VTNITYEAELRMKVIELRFSGNWYTDLCILGFIKLLNEIYGWELQEIRERLRKEPHLIFAGYFPVAYIGWYLIKRLERFYLSRDYRLYDIIEENPLKLENVKARLINKVYELCLEDSQENCNEREVFEKTWQKIEKLAEATGSIILGWINYLHKRKLERISKKLENEFKKCYLLSASNKIKVRKLPIHSDFYHNFMLFNPSLNVEKQKERLQKIVQRYPPLDEEILRKFDRTINKFLVSEKEIPNVYYTPTNAENIYKLFEQYPLVFLMCFEIAFENFGPLGYYAFYSPDLEFTYYVNRRLSALKRRAKKGDVLRLTWKAIIDSLYEKHAKWVLEDMYIIKYKSITRQRIIGVEYIGFDKARATLILDDRIRESLNWRINIGEGEESRTVWLIERFLQGEDLYSIILNYFSNQLSKREEFLEASKLIMALAAEYSIRHRNKEPRGHRLFTSDFFVKIPTNIEIAYSYLRNLEMISSIIKKIISPLYEESEALRSLITILLETLSKMDKNSFMHILLSELNKYPEPLTPKISKKIYRIIFQDSYWYIYALGLLIKLYRR